jgi:hypothetical protein
MDKVAKQEEQSNTRSSRKINLLIGFTGSVATIKDSVLIKRFQDAGMFIIRAVYTKSASHFRTSE